MISYHKQDFFQFGATTAFAVGRCSGAIAGFNISITGAAQLWQLECVSTPDKSTSLYPTS